MHAATLAREQREHEARLAREQTEREQAARREERAQAELGSVPSGRPVNAVNASVNSSSTSVNTVNARQRSAAKPSVWHANRQPVVNSATARSGPLMNAPRCSPAAR